MKIKIKLLKIVSTVLVHGSLQKSLLVAVERAAIMSVWFQNCINVIFPFVNSPNRELAGVNKRSTLWHQVTKIICDLYFFLS
mmetsp:Transcript_19600/g.24169  ORF Transcript_19600/g.24169 Transcript_19600/m.24169 type:complete len:82 (-) Transcript_19600:1195-1440(-)